MWMYLLAVWEGGGKQHDFFKHKITHFKRPTRKKVNINRVYNMHMQCIQSYLILLQLQLSIISANIVMLFRL